MGVADLEFAQRAAAYLRSRGLGPAEVSDALVRELGCTPTVATHLASPH